MVKFLPLRASIEWLKKAAKDRHEANPSSKLHEEQLAIAREYGFSSWRAMVAHIEEVRAQLHAAFPVLRSPEKSSSEQISPADPDLSQLLAAVRAGDVAQVTSLLSARPGLVHARGTHGETPLHVAAEFNDARLAIVLLAHDADPYAVLGQSGHDALSWAVTCNASDFARTLVRLSVKPDFFSAAGIGDLDAVQSFFDESGSLQPNASRTGSSRCAGDGSRLPCPPPSETDQISDSLYIACRNGHEAVVRFLLTKHPDLSFRAYLGGTPLHWAYFGGSQLIVDLLLAAGADPTNRDNGMRCTPRSFGMCVSAAWGLLFKVRQLATQDPTLVDYHDGSTTALHESAAHGHMEIVNYLLASGAKPDLRDQNGKTAKERAAESGHQGVVQRLEGYSTS